VAGTPSRDPSGVALIVGLGNPGAEYIASRHNAGYWFVDAVAARHHGAFRTETRFHGAACRVDVDGSPVRLLKPTTFMNRSGLAVVALAGYFRIPPDQILVVHDDLDFPPGTVRLKSGGGAGGHNGVADVTRALGTDGYRRLRIGIGRPAGRAGGVDYVLGRPSAPDREAIERAIDEALEVLPLMVGGDWERATQHLHSTA